MAGFIFKGFEIRSKKNVEKNLDGLLISLDAKKAFDSVEHSYIEKCLEKFGLGKFIPIFRILYSELKSDVIINGKVVLILIFLKTTEEFLFLHKQIILMIKISQQKIC